MIHSNYYPLIQQDAQNGNTNALTLVVIHGLFGNSDNWNSIAKELSNDFHVYTLDLPNHGKSERLDQPGYDTLATLVYQWMQSKQLEQCVLLGHSMGGKVAMQLASQHPECVEQLIVADIAPVDYESGHHDIFTGLKAIDLQSITSRKQADEILSEYEPTVTTRQFLLKSLVKSEVGFKWIIQLDNLAEHYVHIRAKPPLVSPYQGKTLFIKGENSAYIQQKHYEAIQRWFPQAQVKIIAGTGHWLHAEKPLSFVSLVKRFLAKP